MAWRILRLIRRFITTFEPLKSAPLGVALSFKLSSAVQAVGWAAQTLAVYFIPLVQNFILAVWMSQPQTIMWEIANYIFFALAGLIFGIAVAWALPASTESGRWVWIAPVGLLVVGTVMEMRLSSFNLMTVLGWVRPDG